MILRIAMKCAASLSSLVKRSTRLTFPEMCRTSMRSDCTGSCSTAFSLIWIWRKPFVVRLWDQQTHRPWTHPRYFLFFWVPPTSNLTDRFFHTPFPLFISECPFYVGSDFFRKCGFHGVYFPSQVIPTSEKGHFCAKDALSWKTHTTPSPSSDSFCVVQHSK